MTTTTNYAELATGFIKRFGFVGPITKWVMPELKLTLQVHLKNPEKCVYVNLGASPVTLDVSDVAKPADICMTVDAEIFHYILLGKIPMPKAMNEAILLLEMKSGAMPDMPMIETGDSEPSYSNPLYEAYLINAGAGHLLKEPINLSYPPPPATIRIIELQPDKQPGFLQRFLVITMYIMGIIGGLLFRIILRFKKPPKFVPAEVKYLTFDDVFNLPKTPTSFKPRNKLVLAIMQALFSRVDIIKLMESGVSGLKAARAFNKPIQLLEPMNKALMEQLKQAAQ